MDNCFATGSVTQKKYSVCEHQHGLAGGRDLNCFEMLMTPQDKRKRARKLHDYAATKSGTLAQEIREMARRLEQDADKQERDGKI